MEFTNAEKLGWIPWIISSHDPRSVAEQIESNYAHGGGFNPTTGFTVENADIPGGATLHFTGDPPMKEWGRAQIREELVIVFDHALVGIVQPDGKLAVTRMD